MSSKTNVDTLLAAYVGTFGTWDDLCSWAVFPELVVSRDDYGNAQWRPREIKTNRAALESLYRGLGLSGEGVERLPALYETLILNYRWEEVDMGCYRLLGNEPAEDFSPLVGTMRKDKHLFSTLLAHGYLPFGKGADIDYDPVCFDLQRRQNHEECRIVKLDHEAILCYDKIREITELAPDFRSLVEDTIIRAKKIGHDAVE